MWGSIKTTIQTFFFNPCVNNTFSVNAKFQENLLSGSFQGLSQNTGTFTLEIVGSCNS